MARGCLRIYNVKDRGLVPNSPRRGSGFGPSMLYGPVRIVKKIFKDKPKGSGKPMHNIKN